MATKTTKITPKKAAPKKAAAKTVAIKKGAGGRPSKYTPKFHIPLATRLTLLGQTMTQMADAFEIAESTIWDWKNKFPEFSEAITCARVEADAKVAQAMFTSALGGWVKESKTHVLKDKDGNQFVQITKVDKWIEADVGAQKHWLHNRQSAIWKNAPEDNGNDGDLPPITHIIFEEEDGTISNIPDVAEGPGDAED